MLRRILYLLAFAIFLAIPAAKSRAEEGHAGATTAATAAHEGTHEKAELMPNMSLLRQPDHFELLNWADRAAAIKGAVDHELWPAVAGASSILHLVTDDRAGGGSVHHVASGARRPTNGSYLTVVATAAASRVRSTSATWDATPSSGRRSRTSTGRS